MAKNPYINNVNYLLFFGNLMITNQDSFRLNDG